MQFLRRLHKNDPTDGDLTDGDPTDGDPTDGDPADDNIEQTGSGDLIDPSLLRLEQNFAELAGVKKRLVTVPVRKPHRQEFIRVHPSELLAKRFRHW